MPSKGSTSGQSIADIRAREEARRQARKARQRAKEAPTPQTRVRVTGIRTLVLELSSFDEPNCQIAYQRLDSIALYFKKFKYHEHRQKAVMEGRIVLPDLPGELYVKFLSEMCREGKGWKQGKMEREEVENG